MSCRPIYQDVQEVGKTIKSSKKKFSWKFNVDKKDYTIELFNSSLSGKKKICQNTQIIYENNSYQGAFNFNFSIGKNSLSIVQHGDKFELRINNQAFSHLYENKLQSKHFKTDDKEGDGFDKRISKDKDRAEKKKKSERKREAAAVDEDEDLRRAIELSKKTAQKDEERRKKEEKIGEKGSKKEDADKDGEFDFGAGFEKFATNQNDAGNSNPNDLDGFDFGDVAAKEEKKEDNPDGGEDFDFNFGGDKEADKKPDSPNKEAAPQTGDLLDLLGGLDMNAGSNPPAANPSESTNALDFFNNGDAGGALGNAAAQNAQNPASGGDVFDFNNAITQPVAPVPVAEPEKPKGFMPNPGLAMNDNGGFAMPQQQYGTAMPQGGNYGGQNPFGQQQNYQQQQNQFQTYNQGGFQQQQNFNQGYDQNQQFNQQQQQQQNMGGFQQQNDGFGQQQNFGTGFDQQQQQQQPPQQQAASTPFDMFN